MDLICVICGHEPEDGELYIRCEKWFKSNNGSCQRGEAVMMCSRHTPPDIEQATKYGGYTYREHLQPK